MADVDFEEFVATRADRLLGTARLLTRDPVAAEDLLQTALVKAWSSWHRIEDSPEGYVRRILVRTYCSWRGRRWNGEHPIGQLPERAGDDPAAEHDQRHDLRTALGRLTPRQRAVVALRFYDDLSVAETAEVLGCSEGTVKSTTAKAMANLRSDPALDPQDGGAR